MLRIHKLLKIIKPKRGEDFFQDVSKFTASVLEHLYKELAVEIDNKKGEKPKVLTVCDKNADCRFLSCPNIKEYCMLCEANMKKKGKNYSYCEKIPTRFLFVQRSTQGGDDG